MKPYVIVRHKGTGRAFSLGRRYDIFNADLGIIDPPEKFVDDWDGWLPTFDWQMPSWVSEQLDEMDLEILTGHFHAYWMF